MKLLKEYRQEKGITQLEMADRLGLNFHNYRNYDSGRYKNMPIELQERVSKILGVDYTYYNRTQVFEYNEAQGLEG